MVKFKKTKISATKKKPITRRKKRRQSPLLIKARLLWNEHEFSLKILATIIVLSLIGKSGVLYFTIGWLVSEFITPYLRRNL